MKKTKKLLRKTLKTFLVLILIVSWTLTSQPRLPFVNFPPKPGVVWATQVDTFVASTTWTAPPGVTSVTAEVWGGGGGGGGQNLGSDGGGGGGGGAYSKKNNIVVIPGNGYTVTVGGAGTGGTGCSGQTAGGDSWFSTSGTVLAKGGSPGLCSTGIPPAGGAGGDSASGIGDTVFSGGQGEVGRNNTNGSGGYGGSSAGTASDGWSGPQTWSTITYPSASTPAGAGDGGNAGGIGVNGSAPASGNGGGGGGAGEGTNMVGGNGAAGKIILSYNKPVNAPSQDSPADGATGVSTTPTFTMTASDGDTTTTDNVSYKVTIYSDSGCTSAVQTNDQAVSSTGWTGTNASCTANPTSCYTSGSQGSYLTQTALSPETQYWWKASAKDPDGNGTFVNSSTCKSFTTEAAVATFVQNHYKWYVDSGAEDVSEIWGTPDLTEDGAITIIPAGNDPPEATQSLRLRMNITVNTATITGNSRYFKLQHRTGTDSDCSAGSWTDVDTGAWVYATSAVADDTALSLAKLTGTDRLETYSKVKPATVPIGTSATGEDIEFDFHIIGSSSTGATRYLFRVVETNDIGGTATPLTSYTNCPVLTTEPGTSNLLRHGNVFSEESEKGFFWAN